MRGKKTSIAKTRIDLVLVAARYGPDARKVEFARGYERRGTVWADLSLFDRAGLVERLEQGQKVVTGKASALAGDFEIDATVRLGPDKQLRTERNGNRTNDDLELPIL